MKPLPGLISWASRGAGGIGIVTSILYLALIFGAGDRSELAVALSFFAFMAGAGLLAWFADRVSLRTGRRMMWAAFVLFFVLGVISIFTIGILYLIASVLSIFSLSHRPPTARPLESSVSE